MITAIEYSSKTSFPTEEIRLIDERVEGLESAEAVKLL